MDRKLKVIFVDDERLIRKLIANCVNWDELGYQIAGDSAGGEHAIELILNERPDLVFMDINMPVMNGLEISEKIIEQMPDIRIVMLTGFQDFDYAKQAINIGAYKYLLKPINPTEVIETAKEVYEEAVKKNKRDKQLKKLKERLEKDFPIMRENYLTQMLNGTNNLSDHEQALKYFNLFFNKDYVCVAVIEIEPKEIYNQADNENKTTDNILMMMGARNAILDSIREQRDIYYIVTGNKIVLIINSKDYDIYEQIESIKDHIAYSYDCTVSVGICQTEDGHKNLAQAYEQANLALEYKLVCGRGQIINYDEISSSAGNAPNLEKHLSDLSIYLRAGIDEDAVNIVKDIFELLKHSRIQNIQQLHAIGSKIVSDCLILASEFSVDDEKLLGTKRSTVEQIFHVKTLPDMQKLLSEYVKNLAQRIASQQQFKHHSIVADIRKYIDDNITNSDLSLKNIAAKFYINPSYLSRVYKEFAGVSYVEYVKSKRMEKAIELLKANDLKAYQLSNMVGIEDPHYFSILFKKHTGITLSDYKNKIKNSRAKK